MKNEEKTDSKWITVKGHHVFVRYSKGLIQKFKGKLKISDGSKGPRIHQETRTYPISKREIKELSQDLPEARELRDALKEKYDSEALKAELVSMHENSIRMYGEPSGEYGPFYIRDITDEMIAKAKPGEGRLFTEFTDAEESNPEKAAELGDAKLLAEYFGGNVVHLKERGDIFKVKWLQTPDFMHDERLLDRKSSSGGAAIVSRVHTGSRQIQTPTYAKYDGKFIEGKPGGVLISLRSKENGKHADNKEVCSRITRGLIKTYQESNNPLHVIIKRDQSDLLVIEITKK